MDRREALRRLGFYAAAVGMLGCGDAAGGDGPGAEAGRASAADREGGTLLSSLGLQLYTIRGEMEAGVEAALQRVAEIGYEEVEFAGYFDHGPSEIRAILDRTGLRSPASHVPPTLEGDAWQRVLDDALEIGHDYVVVAWLPPETRTTRDDWYRWTERMNRAGEAARDAGLTFAYHNHDFEFREVGGELPFNVLFENTDPALVQIELDVFWITHAGHDAVEVFRRWPGRIPTIHVKDRTAGGEMADVGSGVIDWPSILAEAELAGVRHPFVEHDEPDGAYRSVAASFRYLETLEI